MGEEDEFYRINQVLMFGDLDEVKAMIVKQGLGKVKKVFVGKPSKIYSKEAFNFLKNFVLKIEEELDPEEYVKTLY